MSVRVLQRKSLGTMILIVFDNGSRDIVVETAQKLSISKLADIIRNNCKICHSVTAS